MYIGLVDPQSTPPLARYALTAETSPHNFDITCPAHSMVHAASAGAWAVLSQNHFNPEVVDGLLATGDVYFRMGGSNAQMTPMELPRDMVILWMEARFTQTVCILESNFHPGATGLQHVTKQLSAALAISLHSTFFLCSSITSTTSFWRHDGAFYSFNTERANSAGVVDQQNELENKVRVFRYETLDSLVKAFWLAGSSRFRIYRLKVIPLEDGKSKDDEMAEEYNLQSSTVSLNVCPLTSLTPNSCNTTSHTQHPAEFPRNSIDISAQSGDPVDCPVIRHTSPPSFLDDEGFQTFLRRETRLKPKLTRLIL